MGTKLSIGGVFLDSPQLEWIMLSGERPAEVQFEVTDDISKTLKLLSNPVTLVMETTTFPDGPPPPPGVAQSLNMTAERGQGAKYSKGITHRFVAENLWLTEIKRASPWLTTWGLTDSRMLFQKARFTRRYNIRRKTNDLEIADFAKTTPLRDVAIIGKSGYLPWTLRKKGTHIPAGRQSGNTVEPSESWTALSMIKDICLNIIEPRFEGVKFDVSVAIDNEDRPPTTEYEQELFPIALSYLFSRAQISMYQNPAGKLVLFNTQYEDKIKELVKRHQIIEGFGFPFRQELKRIRPGGVQVSYPVLNEMFFTHSEGTSSGTSERKDIDTVIENVLPLPETVITSRPLDGKTEWVKGTWVTPEYAITIWNYDTVNPLRIPTKFGMLSVENLRKTWFAGRLEIIYGLDVSKISTGGVNQVTMGRLSALRQHYRQTFRFSEPWNDNWVNWFPTMVSVINPETGARQPSPVFTSYCVVPSFRMPTTKSKNQAAQISAYNVEGFNSKVSLAKPAPATVAMVDKELGIFRIKYSTGSERTIQQIIPSKVDNIPPASAVAATNSQLWQNAELSQNWDLGVIITMQLGEPNSVDNLYILSYSISNSEDRKIEDVHITSEAARYRWTDDTRVELVKGQVSFSNAELVNEKVLEALGQAHAELLRRSWEDRIVGTFALDGWKKDFLPSGPVKGVTVHFDENIGMVTQFNLTDPVPKISIFSLLDPQIKTALRRQLNQAL